MIVIVWACLTATPDRCQEHRAAELPDRAACVTQMVPAGFSWALSHPEWTFKRVECRPADEVAV
ncbi:MULTISPECIES: hypothetical protein [Aurantimonas]|uniref:hypothetical protein n=1 Tax=Aurantimonas TaxID=182269 RepID=UPI0035117503